MHRATTDTTADWLETAGLHCNDDGAVSEHAPSRAYMERVVWPLAQLVLFERCRCVAIAGPAGAGKSTLGRGLAQKLAAHGRRPLTVSLDDFYYSKQERAERGFPFRAPPGTHDLESLLALLERAHAGQAPLRVPRFDPARDDAASPELIEDEVDVVLLDGWFLGLPHSGYEALNAHFDVLVHLSVPAALAKSRRFAREQRLRQQSGGGLSTALMQRLWDEVLGPGNATWVREAEDLADVVLEFDSEERLRRVRSTTALAATLGALAGGVHTQARQGAGRVGEASR